MDAVNRNSKLPLYQQIYEILRTELARGVWQPGDLIPTETDLMARFGVSRIIVRQALDMLVKDGLIYRQRGKGSFVSHPPIEQGLTRIISFTDDMRRRGFRPGTDVLNAELLPAPPPIALPLRVAPGEELAHIQRLRLADGEPLAVEDSYLIHRYCPGILNHDYASNPLRETLEGIYGLRMARAQPDDQGDPRRRCARRAARHQTQRAIALDRTHIVFRPGQSGRVPEDLLPGRPLRAVR